MADKICENTVLSILPPSIPTELVYNVNTRESISETLSSSIFQESNLDLYSTGIAKMQLSTMKELDEKWRKATMPSLVKSVARDGRFYDNLQWSDLLLVADNSNNIPCLVTSHGCYFSVKIGGQKSPNINHMCSVKVSRGTVDLSSKNGTLQLLKSRIKFDMLSRNP